MMSQRLIMALWVVLIHLGIMGCDNTSQQSGYVAISHYSILQKFHLINQPIIKTSKPALKAPKDPLRLKLLHPEPLALPHEDFSVSGSDTLSPVTRKIVANFHDDGYIGTFRLNQSSTGTGMKAMCRGETIDLVNASRLIKEKEKQLCAENGIVPITIKVGYDPFVLITHENNTWFKDIKRHQLKKLFNSQTWSQFNPNYPNNPIMFYAPQKDGGSMAAMTKFVYGTKEAPNLRQLDNANYYAYNYELTHELAEDPMSLGFASFGKLLKLKQLHINTISINGHKPVISGSNYPIKRSLYIVTSTKAIQNPKVQAFIAYYLNNTHKIMPPLGFVPLEGQEALIEQKKLVNTLKQLIPDKKTISIIKN